MAEEEAELMTEEEDEGEEELVSTPAEEYEDQLEDEEEAEEREEAAREQREEMKEAVEGAHPSPDGEDEALLEEAAEEADGSGKPSGKARQRVNPLALLGRLRPGNLLRAVQAQRRNMQRLVWQLEDASVFTVKFAKRVLIKAARPALVWLIVARAMKTLEVSRDPHIRMLRQPPHKQIDYYYTQLLGKNWHKQMEQDLLDALREVDEGYITDEVVREKRRLAAVMLRRMEVEEWDKERMRHFYYGLYGMGPWYWDMEERLHNPFFTGARAWNGPIESWVGESRPFPRDARPEDVDPREAALAALARARGRPVPSAARDAALRREELRGADDVLGSALFRGAVDRLAVRDALDRGAEQRRGEAAPAGA